MTPYALTTLYDVKVAMRSQLRWSVLDTNEQEELETFLLSIIDEVSWEIITTELNRNPKNWSYTEYHTGKIITLENYPLISVTSLTYDPTLEWTSPETLTVDDDYFIEDASAGLIRIAFDSTVINSFKIDYKAGYEWAYVQPSDTLSFKEGVTTFTASLTAGLYDAWSLADMVQSAMNDVSGISNTYSVSFDYETQTFTVSGDTTQFTADYTTTPSTWRLLGIETDTTGSSITSTFAIPTVPQPLRSAATELVLWRYKYIDRDRIGVESESRGDQMLTYNFDRMPRWAERIFKTYRKLN